MNCRQEMLIMTPQFKIQPMIKTCWFRSPSRELSLRKMIFIFISRNINRVKATLSNTSSFNKPNCVREIATNLEHIQDNRNNTDEINRTLPKLHDQFYPPSNKEISFIEQDLISLQGREDRLGPF